jgi:hypothetical protein
MVGALVIGRDRPGVAPVAAYIDEFRMMDLDSQEAETQTFAEHACNLALGSLREGKSGTMVCDQMPIRVNEPADADGVGTGLDFPLEAYKSTGCGANVHRSGADAGCLRGDALGMADKQLVAAAPRPDFRNVAFCRTCHTSTTDPVPGLRIAALEPRPTPARDDARRQPMSFFRTMPGRAPSLGGAPIAPFAATWNGGVLDDVLLGATHTEAPKRVGPF